MSGLFGKEYLARYGAKPQASAEVERGGVVSTDSDSPIEMPDFPQELFRALLVIRAGEARIQTHDKRFMEIFTARVLGGGEIDIQRAISSLKKIYIADNRNTWNKRLLDEQGRAAEDFRLLQQSGDMEQLAERKLKLARELESLGRQLDEQQVLIDALNAEAAFLKLARLKQLQAQYNNAQRHIIELGGVDRSLYMRLTVLRSEIDALAIKAAEKTALLADISDSLKEHTAAKDDVDARLASLAPAALRAWLKRCEGEIDNSEAAYNNLSFRRRGLSSALRSRRRRRRSAPYRQEAV